MQIEFPCPGCRKRFSAPAAQAGRRATCDVCGTAVAVPGVLVPVADRAAAPLPPPMPAPVPVAARADPPADDIPRKRRRRRTPWLAYGLMVGLGVLLVGSVGAAVVLAKRGGRPPELGSVSDIIGVSPTREGETWTHRELMEYLNKKGPAYDITDSSTDFLNFGPTQTIRPTHLQTEYGGKPRVLVEKCPSAELATDRAGASHTPALAWGRFYFRAEYPELIADIRKRLTGK